MVLSPPLDNPAVLYAFFFILGLIVGSFANVCIYRLPREKSIVNPPSACPRCGARIKPWDNIPVLSYIFLRGRCRRCGEPISVIYPLVEVMNGILYVLVLYKYGISWALPFFLALGSALLIITFIDIEFQIIPDEITIPGAIIGIIAGWLLLPDPFARSMHMGIMTTLIGAALGFGLYYVVAVASRGGMGGGDIKMMAMVGAFLGWKGVLLTTFTGSLFGSVIGLYLMVFKGKGRKSKIPFGPFLALGAIVSLLYGQEIANWYLSGWR